MLKFLLRYANEHDSLHGMHACNARAPEDMQLHAMDITFGRCGTFLRAITTWILMLTCGTHATCGLSDTYVRGLCDA
jgi:hypothetical protein